MATAARGRHRRLCPRSSHTARSLLSPIIRAFPDLWYRRPTAPWQDQSGADISHDTSTANHTRCRRRTRRKAILISLSRNTRSSRPWDTSHNQPILHMDLRSRSSRTRPLRHRPSPPINPRETDGRHRLVAMDRGSRFRAWLHSNNRHQPCSINRLDGPETRFLTSSRPPSRERPRRRGEHSTVRPSSHKSAPLCRHSLAGLKHRRDNSNNNNNNTTSLCVTSAVDPSTDYTRRAVRPQAWGSTNTTAP